MGLLWTLMLSFFAIKTVLDFYPMVYEVSPETGRKLDGISLIFFFLFYVCALIETFGPRQRVPQPVPSEIKEKKMDLDPQQLEESLRQPLLPNSKPLD